jgi:hypothetical protein
VRPVPILLVALALLSAGCVGTEEAPSPIDTAVSKITGPTEAELRATPGSIEGLVLTPSVAPIANARVTLLRENVSATTDASGFFRFAGLANGNYLVSAEADGYRARTVEATATNGTVFELNLTLTAAPPTTPFVESREIAGLLSCGVVVDAPTGRQEPPCAAADPNHRDAFEIDLMDDAKGLVLELAWDPSANPGAARLTMLAETVGYGAMDEQLGLATGEGGYARIEVPQAMLEKYYPEGGRYRVVVSLEPLAAPPAGVAFQTAFTVYASAFHHAPAPSGFSLVGGA